MNVDWWYWWDAVASGEWYPWCAMFALVLLVLRFRFDSCRFYCCGSQFIAGKKTWALQRNKLSTISCFLFPSIMLGVLCFCFGCESFCYGENWAKAIHQFSKLYLKGFPLIGVVAVTLVSKKGNRWRLRVRERKKGKLSAE